MKIVLCFSYDKFYLAFLILHKIKRLIRDLLTDMLKIKYMIQLLLDSKYLPLVLGVNKQ